MTREEKSSAGLSGAGIGIRNYFGSSASHKWIRPKSELKHVLASSYLYNNTLTCYLLAQTLERTPTHCYIGN